MPDDRVALVTGVSRRVGIGAQIARRLAAAGYRRLMLTGLPGYDDGMSYGGDPDGVATLLAELREAASPNGTEGSTDPHDSPVRTPHPVTVDHLVADLSDPAAPGRLVTETVRRHGRLDIVVAVHAYSTSTPLTALDPVEIDRHLIVNVRATMLLAAAFAASFTAGSDGRLVLFSSGQRLGPMPGELAYAVSKAAVENLTRQLSPLLMARGITVNCVNPGPTDTGYAPAEQLAAIARLFPGGRWGTPDDAARLVQWLCSRAAGWITGQVIDSEGGFNRHV